MPVLIGITLLSAIFLLDEITHLEAAILLLVFFAYMGYPSGLARKAATTRSLLSTLKSSTHTPLPMKPAIIWLIVGLLLLIVSSRALVWGAVNIAATWCQ